ncbi:hypothetical protein [Aquimonas voraii]|uniref:Homeodomain-like domain-containing protein n=1 Tax=Aquimonas voraii TaxID=265719 RepID=A0A1G6YQC9_9GAMM|nr:hypothetical protein [Aquimonas voraii]SDD91857.1 hypothetical protein SAMN04488509_11091 [Aquimonas voraii]
MNIRLHKNARTTPVIRRDIQQPTGSDYELAERFGVTRDTIRKWRKRTPQQDFGHTAHRLQTSSMRARKKWWCSGARPCACCWTT